MESEAVDSCIQRSLSALYPPFEETAATLLGQVFDVLEKTYQHDALRYIIDFFIPAKHILQTIQQQACEPYAGRRFTHAGWPLCQRGLVLVQLSALDWRQLQPGDFYLQLAPVQQPGRGARLLLRWPAPDGPSSEPVPEPSYPHLFTAEWLDGVNRRLAHGGRGLEWCLAAEGGRIKRLPWRRVVYPLLEPEDEPGSGPGPRPPAIGTRRRPSGDGADAEPRAEAGLKRSLGNGQESDGEGGDAPDGEASTYRSVVVDDDDPQDGDEGEYVELLEASAPARAFPPSRRACAVATLPAAGRRRRLGAQARRGAWLHRRRRRQPDSKRRGGGRASNKCRGLSSAAANSGECHRGGGRRRPEDGPDGGEWMRRLVLVDGPLPGATAGGLPESSSQVAATQSRGASPPAGSDPEQPLAEANCPPDGTERRLVEARRPEARAELSLAAEGESDAGTEQPLAGRNWGQTGAEQPLAGGDWPETGSRWSLAQGDSPKPGTRRSLAGGNSPKSVTQHLSTNLDQRKIGGELSLEERSWPEKLTKISPAQESTPKTGTKHTTAGNGLPKTGTKLPAAEEAGTEHWLGQQASSKTGTRPLPAEEGPPASGTEQPLATLVEPKAPTDQSPTGQPAAEPAAMHSLAERVGPGCPLADQTAAVTGAERPLAARDQQLAGSRHPLAEKVGPRTGIEQPSAEQLTRTGHSLAEPARSNCSLVDGESSAAGTPQLVAVTGSEISLADYMEGDQSNSSSQGSQLGEPIKSLEYAGPTNSPVTECFPPPASVPVDQTTPPGDGSGTPSDRGSHQLDEAGPAEAGESPAPTVLALPLAPGHHEGEEARGVECGAAVATPREWRGKQVTSREAGEQDGCRAEVSRTEHAADYAGGGPRSGHAPGDQGGGREPPCRAPSEPPRRQTGGSAPPPSGPAAQPPSEVSPLGRSEVSSPLTAEVTPPPASEVPSPQPSEVPSPQLSEVPSLPPTKLPSPQLPEVPSSPLTEAPSPQLPEAPSSQPSEAPSPLQSEAPSPQLPGAPSPRPFEVPSHPLSSIPSPRPTEDPSPRLPKVPVRPPSGATSQSHIAVGRGDQGASERSEPLCLDQALAVDPCPASAVSVDWDLLRSEVFSLPGNRDRDGRGLVIVTARSLVLEDARCTSTELARILLYLHTVSRKETRERGLRVLMDAREGWPPAVIWRALDVFQETVPGGVHSVLVLAGKEPPIPQEGRHGFQVEVVPSVQALHERVEPGQLTGPFGGSFRYSHQKWTRFRLSLESLVRACNTSIQFLRGTRLQLEAKRLPNTEQEVSVHTEEDQLLMRHVLQDTRLTGLQQEGAAILVKLKREMVANGGSEDHRDAMETTCALYEQVDEEVHRLVQVSNQRLKDLQSLAEFWQFEDQFREVHDWLTDVGQPQLERSEEMDDSLTALRQRQKKFRDFSHTALEHIQKAERLLQGTAHWDEAASRRLRPYADKLRAYGELVSQFTERLERHRLTIERTIRLHEFFKTAYSWALGSLRTLAAISPDHCSPAEGCQPARQLLRPQAQLHPPIPESRFREMRELAETLGDPRLLERWSLCWDGYREALSATAAARGVPPPPAGPRRAPEGSAGPGGSRTPCPERRAALLPVTPWLSAWSLSGSPPPSSACSSSSSSSPDVRARSPFPGAGAEGGRRDPGRPLKKAQSFELAPAPGSAPAPEAGWPQRAMSEPGGSGAGAGIRIRGLEVSSTQLVDRTCSPREHVMLARRGEILAEAPWGGSPALGPRDKSRPRHALTEAVLAEREYVSSLELVAEAYCQELDRPDVPQGLRGKRGLLFGNLEKLLAFHRECLLPELEGCATCPLRLGEGFLRHKEQFAMYALYVKNKPQSDALLASHGNAFFKRRQLLLRDRTDLAGHLRKPVQRLASYGRLLRELLAECGEDAARERLGLQAAADMVDFQLRHGNDLLAMDAIRGCDVNLKEQGQLLRRDRFTVSCGRHKCLRHVFLFEELVVFTKFKRSEGGSESYVYKSSLKTADMGLTENIGDTGLRFELWFRRRRPTEAHVLQAETPDVKRLWTQDIAQLLWRQASRNKELRLQEMVSMGMGSKVFLGLQTADGAVDQGETGRGKAVPK